MFRIVCDPSSGSTELCLTEITLSGSYESWNFNSGNYLFTTDTK